jgi:broad specificity phosphatase PhoE
MALCEAEALMLDERLNEMEFFTLANLLQQQQNVPIPQEREEFVTYLPMLMNKWRASEIDNPPESYQTFQTRTQSVIEEISQGRGAAIVVTSGGLIAMALRGVLDLDTQGFSRLALAIMNSSMHRLHSVGGDLMMTQFNTVPHLEDRERHHAQTHL